MRRATILSALLLVSIALHAQEASKVLETFRRNFAIASLDVKIQILQDASNNAAASEFGPLYQQAVDFTLNNTTLIPSDPRFRQLVALAADQLALSGYQPAKYSLWKVFLADSDANLRVRIASALGSIAIGDSEIIKGMNQFLDAQNSIQAAGKNPDAQVVASVVTALGKLGDPSSFPILFTAMSRQYSDVISASAKEALLASKGNLKDLLIGVIKNGTIPEKKLALTMALSTDPLSSDQKAQTAEYALDVALHLGAADGPSKTQLREIRFIATRALEERKWSSATPLLIEGIDMTIVEYDRGLADKSFLIEAIAALGAMGTHEAAVRLTQYLVLLNSYTEKGKGFDEQIVLALLDNLGALGDKVAFDDLMYTQYLGYTAAIKKTARAALEKLKW